MVSWTRRITARPCALIRDRDSVEENTDIDITHLYLMISSIRIVYFVFFCIIIPQIKKNYIKGGKILVRTYVFRVKPGTPLAILKSRKLQVFTVHEGQNITTSLERDVTCWLTSWSHLLKRNKVSTTRTLASRNSR